MPAEYAFDQLMGFSDLQKLGRFAYSGDCRTSAEEIVRLLMCPNVHRFLVTGPNRSSINHFAYKINDL